MSETQNWVEDQSEALLQRGFVLENLLDRNGVREVQILNVDPAVNGQGGGALLVVQFFNDFKVAEVRANPSGYFQITGGSRVQSFQLTPVEAVDLPAEWSTLNTAKTAVVKVTPLGDYSEYAFTARSPGNETLWDPLFQEVKFRFRPDCYSTDCRRTSGVPPGEKLKAPMDYLARDYDGFRHMLFSYMGSKVPGWRPSSEADLDQVLISLISGIGDQLADFQDRVMSEAHFWTARKRVSLARHARLVDYHIHEGRQSTGWMFVTVKSAGASFWIESPFQVSLKTPSQALAEADLVWSVEPGEKYYVAEALNNLDLYDWSGAKTVLKKGSTSMDLTSDLTSNLTGGSLTEESAKKLRDHIQTAQILWIEELRSPKDGSEGGRDPLKRQRLRILPGPAGAREDYDPIEKKHFVRVTWQEEDALSADYFFRLRHQDQALYQGARVHGNLVYTTQGQIVTESFSLLGGDSVPWLQTQRWGLLCVLKKGPVLFKTLSEGGQKEPRSSVRVKVLVNNQPLGEWEERESFVLSDDSDQNGRHFVVETDENRISTVRFGNGIHGQKVPDSARIEITYQKGKGEEGNIGADRIHYKGTYLNHAFEVRNPWEISDGVGPEPVDQIMRRVPEIFRLKQHRAVTLEDLVAKTQEHPAVDKAKASYVWTGSWRAVRVLVDVKPPAVWGAALHKSLRDYLSPLMMIGEDLEIRVPRYVPLLITVTLCIRAEYSRALIRTLLNEEFSAGFTSRGRKGFFHPSLWTFGQALEESPLLARVHAVEGVDHVESISSLRWGEKVEPVVGRVEIGSDDIIQVLSHPDGAEKGYIQFRIKGGRP